MNDVAYDRAEWLSAIEGAELAEWDEIDAGEQHGPLAEWLCREAYDHDEVRRDVDVITAAVNALRDAGREKFSPDTLITVLWSNLGEIWCDDAKPRKGDGGPLILAEPEGSGSLARYLFDTTKW